VDYRAHSRHAEQRFTKVTLAAHVTDLPIHIDGSQHYVYLAYAAGYAFVGGDDGAPGLRPHDRVRYYAAFVRDPDGNRIEAVTFPKG